MESLIEFWAIVVDVWNNAAFGRNLGRIVVGVGVFALFLVIRRLFARFVISWLKRLTQKTTTDIDDQTIDALEKPCAYGSIRTATIPRRESSMATLASASFERWNPGIITTIGAGVSLVADSGLYRSATTH